MLSDFELSFMIISLSLACIAYSLLAKFRFFYLQRSRAITAICLLFLQLVFFIVVKYFDISITYYYLFPFEILYIFYFSELLIKDEDPAKPVDYINLYSFIILAIGYFVLINGYMAYQLEFQFVHSLTLLLLLIRFLIKYIIYARANPSKQLKNTWVFQTLIILCIVEFTTFILSLNTSFSIVSLQITILAYLIFTIVVLAVFIYKTITKLQTKFAEDKEDVVITSTYENNELSLVTIPNTDFEVSDIEKQLVTTEKYRKSKLSFEELQKIRAKLQKIQSEELFLNPELNLDFLSNHFKIPKYTLSQAFSSVYGTNFKDHVNTLRCEYAIKQILNKNSTENIIEIAYLSGYNSKTSFYRAFNKIYKCTPIEFKQKMMN